MKKIVLTVFLSFLTFPIEAHTILGNASNLTKGTIPTDRIGDGTITPNKLASSVHQGTSTVENDFRNYTATADVKIANLIGSKIPTIHIASNAANLGTADVLSDFTTGFVQALTLLKAAGLTHSTTGQGTIVFHEGIYRISGATIPAGVTVFCVPGSSVVFTVDETASSSGTIFVIYGTLDGGFIDMSNRPFKGELLKLQSNGTLKNIVSYGNGGMETIASGNTSIISVRNSTHNFITNIRIRDCLAENSGVLNAGSGGALIIHNSTFVHVRQLNISSMSFIQTGDGTIGIYKSNDVRIEDCMFEKVGGAFIAVEGGNLGLNISRNSFYITQGVNANGIIVILPAITGTGDISTGTVISNNSFYHWQSVDTAPLIGVFNSTYKTYGVLISDNFARSYTGSAVLFTNVATNVVGTVYKGNYLSPSMVFITDSGVNTNYTNNDNFVGSVEQ